MAWSAPHRAAGSPRWTRSNLYGSTSGTALLVADFFAEHSYNPPTVTWDAIPSTGRATVKPAGTLRAATSGQYANLRALVTFRQPVGTQSNEGLAGGTFGVVTIASPTPPTTAQGADDLGGALYIPLSETGGVGFRSSLSLPSLGIASGSSWTAFARVRSQPAAYSDGTDRSAISLGDPNGTGVDASTYGTIWEVYTKGAWTDYGNRAADPLQTICLTFDGTTLRFYVNGSLRGSQPQTYAWTSSDFFQVSIGQSSWYEAVYEAGLVSGAWSSTEVASYDANPLAGLEVATISSASDVSLTATPPTTSAPVLGTPAASTAAKVNVSFTVPNMGWFTPQASQWVTALTVGTGFTATPPATSAPVLGSPTASRVFPNRNFTATEPATSAPVLASTALTRVFPDVSFTATPPATSAPTLGTPTLTRVFPNVSLSVVNLIPGAPSLATPALTQVHSLVATAPSTSAPVLGSPAASVAATTVNLVASPPATSAPELGTPAASRAFPTVSLAATAPATSAPAPASPGFGQVHQLLAAGLAAGAVILGSPGLSTQGSFAPVGVELAAPALASPAVSQGHVLAPAGLDTPAPVLDSPAPSTRFSLGTPSGLAAGQPSLGTSALTQAHQIAANAFSGQAPVLGSSALVQGFSLVPASPATSAPALATTALTQRHVLTATPPALSAPDVGLSGLVQAGLLTMTPVLTGQPTIGAVTVSQRHVLTATASQITAPAVAQVALVQRHELGTPAGLAAGQPELGTPSAGAESSDVALVARDLAAGNAYPDHTVLTQRHMMAPDDLATPAPVIGHTADPGEIEDPLGLGEFMIVSLTEAKRHLRIDHDLEDDDVTLKLLAAEAEVLDYINRPSPWLDANGNEVPAPAPIRAATLMVLGDLHSNRDEGIVGAIHTINPTARRLLARYRNFD